MLHQIAGRRIEASPSCPTATVAKLAATEEIARLVHYDPHTKVLSVEDHQLCFYLRNLDWFEVGNIRGHIEDGPDDLASRRARTTAWDAALNEAMISATEMR